MNHTISILVENKFGVLARIAGMFSGRGFNIDTLHVAPTLNPHISRMTIVLRGNEQTLEQVTKQLEKLINVIYVEHCHSDHYIDRELVLIKIRINNIQERNEIMQLCIIFACKIIDIETDTITIEITDKSKRIDTFLILLKPYTMIDAVRTGIIAFPYKNVLA